MTDKVEVTEVVEDTSPVVEPEVISSEVEEWPSISVTLNYPVDIPGHGKPKKLVFREPDVEALERIEALNLKEGAQVKLFEVRAIAEALAGFPEGSLKKLNHRDIKKVSEEVAPFFQVALGDG